MKLALARNMDDEESRAYWKFIEETAAEVATWPCWMRGCPGCDGCLAPAATTEGPK